LTYVALFGAPFNSVADVRTHGMPRLRVDEDGMRAAWDPWTPMLM